MRRLRAVVALLLLAGVSLVGCTVEAEKCVPDEFEHATVLRCERSGYGNFPTVTVALAGLSARYFVGDKISSVDDTFSGESIEPKIQRYDYTHVNVIRKLDIDMVEIEVSQMCPGTSWDRDANKRLLGPSCQYQGAPWLFHQITVDEARAVIGDEPATMLEQLARDARRRPVFGLYCISTYSTNHDGTPYTGSPGCPA